MASRRLARSGRAPQAHSSPGEVTVLTRAQVMELIADELKNMLNQPPVSNSGGSNSDLT